METSRPADPNLTPGRAKPADARPEPPASGDRSQEAAAPVESVTAYDHLWFERRPLR